MTQDDIIPRALAYRRNTPSSLGGPLFKLLHDHKVTKAGVHYCRTRAAQEGDAEGVALCDLMMAMPERARREVAVYSDGHHRGFPLRDEESQDVGW